MPEIADIGTDWIVDEVEGLTDEVIHVSPSTYNEENRYLPESVTSIPGYIRYAVNPFMREIVDCFDVDSPLLNSNVLVYDYSQKTLQIFY